MSPLQARPIQAIDRDLDLLEDPPAPVPVPRAAPVGRPSLLSARSPGCPTWIAAERRRDLSPVELGGTAAPRAASIHVVMEQIAASGLAAEPEVEHHSPRGISFRDGGSPWHVRCEATSFAHQLELLA